MVTSISYTAQMKSIRSRLSLERKEVLMEEHKDHGKKVTGFTLKDDINITYFVVEWGNFDSKGIAWNARIRVTGCCPATVVLTRLAAITG